MAKIAILGIKTYPAFAGADRVVENLLAHYSKDNEYFIYLLKQKNKMKLESKGNLRFIYIPSIKGKHLNAFVYFLLCTLHVIFKGTYDLIHIHNVDFGLFVPFLKIKGYKIIGTSHGRPYLIAKWGKLAKFYLRVSEKLFFAFCDIITTVQKTQLSIVNKKYLRKTFYIPNGIPKVEFSTEDNFDYSKYGLSKMGYILFACGRLDPTKGLHYLLDAYISGGFREKLLIIGDFNHAPDPYRFKIEKRMETSENIVAIKELLPKELLYNILKNCKLFVFPSEVEAASMLLLEAIACRAPVVCSDIEENKDIVGWDYKYLFKLGDRNDLINKMKLAIEDKDIDKVVENLYIKCLNEFSWERIAKKYEELYLKLLNEKYR